MLIESFEKAYLAEDFQRAAKLLLEGAEDVVSPRIQLDTYHRAGWGPQLDELIKVLEGTGVFISKACRQAAQSSDGDETRMPRLSVRAREALLEILGDRSRRFMAELQILASQLAISPPVCNEHTNQKLFSLLEIMQTEREVPALLVAIFERGDTLRRNAENLNSGYAKSRLPHDLRAWAENLLRLLE